MSNSFSIIVDGIEDLQRDLERKLRAASKPVLGAQNATARAIQRRAKANAPVGTKSKYPGLLRRSILLKASKDPRRPSSVWVFEHARRGDTGGAPHGHLVELGTRRMPARPFFRPAIEAERNTHAERIEKAVQEALDA